MILVRHKYLWYATLIFISVHTRKEKNVIFCSQNNMNYLRQTYLDLHDPVSELEASSVTYASIVLQRASSLSSSSLAEQYISRQ